MAIGDGENDIEMLELASLGVAFSNGAEKTKAIADVIGMSNDEDGVADAIYRNGATQGTSEEGAHYAIMVLVLQNRVVSGDLHTTDYLKS
ncbi:Endoribonuclease ybey protein [Thalictrum thalictroides]|uniref:Endoribonuclease ybey protein n=1 Tax=Thalictrum thalictroides TaxID=46969 RepID=A0A7J6WZL5_THATH|nr:Endoribonuclease ybey protein [Thalictrum thalictroides]